MAGKLFPPMILHDLFHSCPLLRIKVRHSQDHPLGFKVEIWKFFFFPLHEAHARIFLRYYF